MPSSSVSPSAGDLATCAAPIAPAAPDEVAERVRGSLCANFGDVLHQAALCGEGLSMHPVYMVEEDLRAGRLLAVLPETPPRPLDVVALYSSRRHLPSRVRLLLDHLQRWARKPPAWAAPYRPVPAAARQPTSCE